MRKIAVVGIVLAVDYGGDLPPCEQVLDDFEKAGYDVQEVVLHIDGLYRVSVLA